LEDIHNFIHNINNNTALQDKLMDIEMSEFPSFIKNIGYSFTVDEFLKVMQELDRQQYASNKELSDMELDFISGGGSFIYRFLQRLKSNTIK